MYSYIVRRLLFMIPTVFIIAIISFVILELPPGDYLTSYITQLQAQGYEVSQSEIAALEKRYGLNQPSYIRFFKWIGGILKGDFGVSWAYEQPVIQLLKNRLPYTVIMSLSTLVFVYLVAIPTGIYSAVKQYTIGDYFATTFGFLGLSTPNFMLALILMYIFNRYFGISIGGLFSDEYLRASWSFAKFIDMLNHLWVPIIVIGTARTAGTIRLMRGLLLDELGRDYLKTARAKGLKESTVILKHAVKVAINPIVSTIGWQLPLIISGAAIVSIVLSLPTTGPLLLNALQQQDMYLAASFILTLSILTVIGTFISDILLVYIDPRIKYQ